MGVSFLFVFLIEFFKLGFIGLLGFLVSLPQRGRGTTVGGG